jgi:hypothetical protein
MQVSVFLEFLLWKSTETEQHMWSSPILAMHSPLGAPHNVRLVNLKPQALPYGCVKTT